MPTVLDSFLKKRYNACGLGDIHFDGDGFGADNFDHEFNSSTVATLLAELVMREYRGW